MAASFRSFRLSGDLFILGMMKKILIPTDFSEGSFRTIKGVSAFLRHTADTCYCLLLNTYMVPSAPPGEIIRLNDELRKKSLEGLQQALTVAESTLAGECNGHVAFDIASQIGSFTNVIPRVVEEQGIDWVIVGKNGDLKQEKVVALLNRLHCPVVVIP